MSDLTESRISEIRTDYALAHDLLDTAVWISSIAPESTHAMRILEAVMHLRGERRSRPSPESVEHLLRNDPWAAAIATRIRQHDSPEAQRRKALALADLAARSAPLDPSSAPGIGRIVARYASETRRLRAELESARSPEAGSGTVCVVCEGEGCHTCDGIGIGRVGE